MDNSDADLDFFWKELSGQIGLIPYTVRTALEMTQFIHAGLACLDDRMIDSVEADIRCLPSLHNKPENEVAALLRFKGRVGEFRFVAGERCMLKIIAQTIRESGVQRFLKLKTTVGTDASNTADTDVCDSSASADLNPVEAEVRAGIYNYYFQRCDAENHFFDPLANLKVYVDRDSNGDFAVVTCPFCAPEFATRIKLRPDNEGSWINFNFLSHIRRRHDDLCVSLKRP